MSVTVSAWVWEHAPVKSGELVVLLKMADNAHDDGGGIFPSQSELAEKSRMTERQIRNCLASLENKGLIRKCGTTGKGIIVWRILMGGGGAENFSGGKPTSGGGGSPLPTEPSIEPSEDLSGGAGAQASLLPESSPPKPKRKPVTYRGRTVRRETVEEAEDLLEAFNAAFARNLSGYTHDGAVSAHLRQVIGALLARPEVDHADWLRAIVRTAENPPGWVEGRALQLGDIFGERAIDHALANTGVPTQPRRGSSSTRNAGILELARRASAGEFGD